MYGAAIDQTDWDWNRAAALGRVQSVRNHKSTWRSLDASMSQPPWQPLWDVFTGTFRRDNVIAYVIVGYWWMFGGLVLYIWKGKWETESTSAAASEGRLLSSADQSEPLLIESQSATDGNDAAQEEGGTGRSKRS